MLREYFSLMQFYSSLELFYVRKHSNFSPLTRKEYFHSVSSLHGCIFSYYLSRVAGIENLDHQLACNFAKKGQKELSSIYADDSLKSSQV